MIKNVKAFCSIVKKHNKTPSSNYTRPFEFDVNKLIKLNEEIKCSNNNNQLYQIIVNKINQDGPMNIADYMASCLFHSDFGYYSTKEYVFGEKGDFITSPEISQVFGEMLTIWIYKQLESYEFPAIFDLMEIGPGRGFMACDISRSMKNILPNQNMNYYLIEKSPKLRKIQQENIMSSQIKNKSKSLLKTIKKNTKLHFMINTINEDVDYIESSTSDSTYRFIWLSSLDHFLTINNKSSPGVDINAFQNISTFSQAIKLNSSLNPLIILTNELFDALPIHKIIYKNGSWKEVIIKLDENKRLMFSNTTEPTDIINKFIIPEVTFNGLKLEENDEYEYSVASVKYMSYLCMLMSQRSKSSALIIDYGEPNAFSNSFRGIKQQKILKNDEILKLSGQCDLSAYVNFSLLKRVCNLFPSIECAGIIKQGDFLELMGITNRLEVLLKNTNKAKEVENIKWQHDKLTSANEMGDTFKFMNIKRVDNKFVYPFIDDILDKI